MTINRVTQRMMVTSSLAGLQNSLATVARTQEQLSSGRALNRPSDDPSGTDTAMRLRQSLAATTQYARNAQDGTGWLDQADTALGSVGDQLLHAQDLITQGVNGAMTQSARDALSSQLQSLRTGILGDANTTYLGRPIFGGVTGGTKAYDATGTYVGTPGAVNRTVADGMTVRVDVDGPSVLGSGAGSVFDHLDAAAAAVSSGDVAGMQAALTAVQADFQRVTDAHALVGSTTNQITSAVSAAQTRQTSLTSSLQDIENTDLPKAAMDLQLQTVAYQAALGAASKALQPSLMEFLR
ncbi:flagellar hook-associated protein FlgL [Lapillicoccus jejuensis]|uniref:Flagellar hook-associated protein 3 FlgL n=1 Tax=Lapillicoccus jejuensis TaxID=402171 RepID=A0A542E4D6_9MICO|nr:flagellar hook-associated protein FlgL [Lapillicoccus jejuensis]TQJ10177.1 flagellar hook-associated protein 3 FlgL [Lapillicoccus jejuensis]